MALVRVRKDGELNKTIGEIAVGDVFTLYGRSYMKITPVYLIDSEEKRNVVDLNEGQTSFLHEDIMISIGNIYNGITVENIEEE